MGSALHRGASILHAGGEAIALQKRLVPEICWAGGEELEKGHGMKKKEVSSKRDPGTTTERVGGF